ncbi:hypothetical protein ACFV2Z_22435 [Streptomyces sp. NPDC059688]|uniref:hypothetical protein n=1 Tax=Streptomyces sp. NPDC059688 TaxID=3346906 RepID=UPI003683D6F9
MGERLSGDGVPVRHRRMPPDGTLSGPQDTIAVEMMLAATIRAHHIDPEAEQRALTAFRAAALDAGVPRARTRRRDDWRPPAERRLRRPLLTFGAVLASLTLGGAAVAAIHSAGSPAPGAGTNETTVSPPAVAPGQPGDTASSLPPGGSQPADGSSQAHNEETYCRTYHQAQKHGTPPDRASLLHLIPAAGGKNKVAAYCSEQNARAATAPNAPAGPDQAGKRTAGPGPGPGLGNDTGDTGPPNNGTSEANPGGAHATSGSNPENGSKGGDGKHP